MLDAASLTMLVIGGVCFARGFAGLARLRDGYVPSTAPFAATQQFARDERLAVVGLALAALGLVVGIVATVLARRRRTEQQRRATNQSVGSS